MSRIGVFGGTFAPFHKGHAQGLAAFLKLANLDRCLVIPSGIPPHKTKTALFTDRQRLEMTTLACEGMEGVTVSDWEITREGRSYTYKTLQWLKEQYPDDRLVLFVGSDMFLTLHQWYHPEEIFALAEIAAFSRTGEDWEKLTAQAEALKETFPEGKIRLYSEPPFPVSSTEIREKWEQGKDLSDLLPPPVWEYLKFLRYQQALQNRLSPFRMNHSLGVMKQAVELATIHGADVTKARVAGLLHDMTKELDKEEHFRLFERYHFPVDEHLKECKNLWHGPSASLDITETFGITDPEIASAIRYHTTAKADMTLLEAILYIADLTDETRDYDDVDFYRALAREDVYKACLVALQWCKADLEQRGLTPHRNMLEAIDWLQTRYPNVCEASEKQRLNYPTKGT